MASFSKIAEMCKKDVFSKGCKSERKRKSNTAAISMDTRAARRDRNGLAPARVWRSLCKIQVRG